MRRLLTALTVTCLLTAFVVSAQEAPKRERGGPAAGPGGRGMAMLGLSPQAMEKIGLTEDQKQKAGEIRQKYAPQLEELYKKIREEFLALLTEEQKTKLDEVRKEEMRQRFGQGRGGAEKGAGKGRAKPDAEK